jgi:hypothetical protein
MHGGLHHFKDLIARRKARQSKQKQKFNKKNLNYISQKISEELEFPEISNYKLEELKGDIRREANSRKFKELIVFLIILSVLMFLFLKYIV